MANESMPEYNKNMLITQEQYDKLALVVADTGFKSGYVTRNEAREKLGLPAVEGGDIFLEKDY